MPIPIVPALLASNEKAFVERLSHKDMRILAPLWQVDILNGSLIPQKSWADPRVLARRFSLPHFELHLMIENPLPVIEEWVKYIPTTQRAIIHAEIGTSLEPVLKRIKELHLEVGLALSPETPLSAIEPFADLLDVLLILGVHPGASGQKFLGKSILKKIEQAKSTFPHIVIAVDGGITEENASKIIDSGANQLCISSAIWQKEDPVRALRNFLLL